MLTEAQMCLRMDVQRALDRLGQRQRQVLLLIAVEGLSVRDTALITGMDRNACYRLFRRTRKLLRHRLRPLADVRGAER